MTLDEYMNDPEIIHEPQAMREIHAIRLKIYDETCNLTPSERTALVHKTAQEFLAEPIKVNLIGMSANELAG
ncbi:MAG: hypothetical protein Ta2A_13010 [Treponemataceae bacterium]|nr:MAG: hypothetical protein Ta2A_13010 [Treponemataceae bacterium]